MTRNLLYPLFLHSLFCCPAFLQSVYNFETLLRKSPSPALPTRLSVAYLQRGRKYSYSNPLLSSRSLSFTASTTGGAQIPPRRPPYNINFHGLCDGGAMPRNLS